MTEILPPVVVREAPVLVNAADPERVMSPVALIGPVGAIEVPPVMRTVPAEAVREPAPPYVVFGVASISTAATDDPTLMDVVVEVSETRLVLEVIAAEVESSVLARRVTEVEAETAAETVTVVPVETTETDPEVEVSVAVEFETAAEPESEILPNARIAPVGETEVPPLMEIDPLVAVSVPAPE